MSLLIITIPLLVLRQSLLLEKLGYEVIIPEHIESGRTWLSKGLVRKAKKIVNKNIRLLHPLITAETPLIGIEPSAILTFRDEYVDLADDEHLTSSKTIGFSCFFNRRVYSKRNRIREYQCREYLQKKKETIKAARALPAKSIVVSSSFRKIIIIT